MICLNKKVYSNFQNKVFHSLGARLSEPVDEELLKEDGISEEKLKELEAVAVKVFILSHDPPSLFFFCFKMKWHF